MLEGKQQNYICIFNLLNTVEMLFVMENKQTDLGTYTDRKP